MSSKVLKKSIFWKIFQNCAKFNHLKIIAPILIMLERPFLSHFLLKILIYISRREANFFILLRFLKNQVYKKCHF